MIVSETHGWFCGALQGKDDWTRLLRAPKVPGSSHGEKWNRRLRTWSYQERWGWFFWYVQAHPWSSTWTSIHLGQDWACPLIGCRSLASSSAWPQDSALSLMNVWNLHHLSCQFSLQTHHFQVAWADWWRNLFLVDRPALDISNQGPNAAILNQIQSSSFFPDSVFANLSTC